MESIDKVRPIRHYRASSGARHRMKLAQRYLSRRLTRTILLGMPGLCGALLLAHGGPLYEAFSLKIIDLGELFIMFGLWVPMILYLSMPIIAAAAVGFCYLTAVNDRELVAFYATGLSPSQLAIPAMRCGTFAALICALMSLYLLPESSLAFQDRMFLAERSFSPANLSERRVNSIRGTASVYFKRRVARDTVEDIVLRANDGDDTIMIVAKSAVFSPAPGRITVSFFDGTWNKRTPAGDDSSAVSFVRYTYEIATAADGKHNKGYFDRQIGQLLAPPADLGLTPGQRQEWLMEGHKRVLHPFLTLAYAMMAAVFALYSIVRAQRFFFGTMAGFMLALAAVHAGYLVALSFLVRSVEIAPGLIHFFPALVLAGSLLALRRLAEGRARTRAVHSETGPHSSPATA